MLVVLEPPYNGVCEYTNNKSDTHLVLCVLACVHHSNMPFKYNVRNNIIISSASNRGISSYIAWGRQNVGILKGYVYSQPPLN